MYTVECISVHTCVRADISCWCVHVCAYLILCLNLLVWLCVYGCAEVCSRIQFEQLSEELHLFMNDPELCGLLN